MNVVGAAARRGIPRMAQTDAAQARREALQHGKHIELSNVPRSATPADIRRAIARAKLQGVSDVAIDYHHFMPTGRALLTLTKAGYLRDNLRALENLSIAGLPVSADPKLITQETPVRRRGAKGRAEAVERGVVIGVGPNGGIANDEKHVTIWGLPGKLGPESVNELVRDFKLASADLRKPDIIKVPAPEGQFTMVSRFLVTMESVSEAHRLVRHLHLQYYKPDLYGEKFPLRARIVY
ncbi:hypothetical protein BD779DRAFT_1502349 [Infundibulicybe gibba]|nr:hypothetical protein BD779DRAFT_1502349 [Infundibulicybe gibba]